MQDSEMGVSITRFGPKLAYRPPVIPQMPPIASGPPAVPFPPTMSSPRMSRFGSRSISALIVRESASRMVIFAMLAALCLVGDVDVFEDVRGGWNGRRARFLHCCVDQCQHFGVDVGECVGVQQVLINCLGAECLEAVASRAQAINLAGRAITLRITLEMTIEALGIELNGHRA